MNVPRHETDTLPTDSPEVRSYLKKLLSIMFIGIVIMAVTAVWAWQTYGKKLADAPPLPEGTPPLSSAPITTR